MRTAEERKTKRLIGAIFHAIMIVVAVGVFWFLYIQQQYFLIELYLLAIVIFMIFHLHYVFIERRYEKAKE